MLTEKRHSLILSMLEEKGALSVTELVEQLNTSESTIRRDLVTLDRGGWLKKVHGGAVKPDSGVIMTEPNVTDKKDFFLPKKKKLQNMRQDLSAKMILFSSMRELLPKK